MYLGGISINIGDPVTRNALEENRQDLYTAYRELLIDADLIREAMWFAEIDVYEYENMGRKRVAKNMENPYIPPSTKTNMEDFLYDRLPPEPAPEEKEKIVRQKKGHIYILSTRRGEYKIGRTTQEPTERLGQISPQLPYPVELYLVYETDNVVEDESRLHKRYENQRLNGEWFYLTQEDIIKLQDEGFKEWKE